MGNKIKNKLLQTMKSFTSTLALTTTLVMARKQASPSAAAPVLLKVLTADGQEVTPQKGNKRTTSLAQVAGDAHAFCIMPTISEQLVKSVTCNDPATGENTVHLLADQEADFTCENTVGLELFYVGGIDIEEDGWFTDMVNHVCGGVNNILWLFGQEQYPCTQISTMFDVVDDFIEDIVEDHVRINVNYDTSDHLLCLSAGLAW